MLSIGAPKIRLLPRMNPEVERLVKTLKFSAAKKQMNRTWCSHHGFRFHVQLEGGKKSTFSLLVLFEDRDFLSARMELWVRSPCGDRVREIQVVHSAQGYEGVSPPDPRNKSCNFFWGFMWFTNACNQLKVKSRRCSFPQRATPAKPETCGNQTLNLGLPPTQHASHHQD